MSQEIQIEKKMNELASKVIPEKHLQSFLDLDLKSKVVGIMTFAQMGHDEKVIEMCLSAMKYIS